MGIWGRVASSVTGYLKGSRTPSNTGTWTKTWTSNGTKNVMTVTKGAANTMSSAATAVNGTVGNGIKQFLTWGNTFKVAVVGAFTYLFLEGGASNVVSTTLGVPQWVGQVIVVFAFVVVLMVIVKVLMDYARDRFDMTSEYPDRPGDGRNGIFGNRYNGYIGGHNGHSNRYNDRRYR